MNEQDYQREIASDPELSERLDKVFRQKVQTIEELMKEHGAEAIIRMFEPRKKDKLKEIRK